MVGKENIKAAVFALFGKDTPLKVDYGCGTLDAQQGCDGGVVLLVTGTITTDPGATAQKVRTFVQTFYLAPALTTAKSGRPCPLAPARCPPPPPRASLTPRSLLQRAITC